MEFNEIISLCRSKYKLEKLKIYMPKYYDLELDNALSYQIACNNIDYEYYLSYIKRNDSKYYRLSKRIELMLKLGKCWFCTWTISDNNLSKNHSRKLKQLYKGSSFVINVDYAPKTFRKHYHGIIVSDTEPKKWDYGFCKFEPIRNDSKFLARYINKFTAHALKENVEKIIYSRDKQLRYLRNIEDKKKLKF